MQGSFSMTNETQPGVIDPTLVDKVHAMIPKSTWPAVIKGVVSNIVDNMPGSVVEQLTGSYCDFEEAENILLSYYQDESRADGKELITDFFGILGAENVLYYLDSLQLDKLADHLNNKPSTEDVISETGEG